MLGIITPIDWYFLEGFKPPTSNHHSTISPTHFSPPGYHPWTARPSSWIRCPQQRCRPLGPPWRYRCVGPFPTWAPRWNISGWWLEHAWVMFPYWEWNNHPNWLSHFQRGWKHQPDMYMYIYIYMSVCVCVRVNVWIYIYIYTPKCIVFLNGKSMDDFGGTPIWGNLLMYT